MCKLGSGVATKCFAGIDTTLTKNKRTALHVAAREGKEICLATLIRNGATLNLKDKDGATPLALAAWKNHCNIINQLTLAGAQNKSLTGKQIRNIQKCLKEKPKGDSMIYQHNY